MMESLRTWEKRLNPETPCVALLDALSEEQAQFFSEAGDFAVVGQEMMVIAKTRLLLARRDGKYRLSRLEATELVDSCGTL